MFKVFLFLIFGSLLLGKSIEHYDVLAKQYTQDHEHYLVSRTFIRDDTRYYLLTNTDTLNSKSCHWMILCSCLLMLRLRIL